MMKILDWYYSQLSKLRPVEYHAYLRSRKWKNKRLGALKRAGYRCQINATHTKNLHVHHNTYLRLGFERPKDLIVLCAGCHGMVHATSCFPIKSKNQTRRIVVNDAYSLDVEV